MTLQGRDAVSFLERVTDEQWKKLEPFLPKLKPGKQGGHPWADNRAVFEGILWITSVRRAVEGLARRVPEPGDLLASLEQVERGRRLGRRVARAPSPARRARAHRLAGDIHRRDVHAGDAVVSLKARGLAFIMPLPSKGKKTKDLQRGRGSYTTTSTLNKEPIVVAIIVKRNTLPSGRRKYHSKKPGNQYFPYIVHGIHAGPKRLDALYRLRGGIESSYKLSNKARARTTSKRPAVRLFYFATSFLIQNAWVVLAWRVSAPTRGQQGRVRPPGFFTLTRFLRLVRAWTEMALGLVETVTRLPSREGRRFRSPVPRPWRAPMPI